MFNELYELNSKCVVCCKLLPEELDFVHYCEVHEIDNSVPPIPLKELFPDFRGDVWHLFEPPKD